LETRKRVAVEPFQQLARGSSSHGNKDRAKSL
jgi:hypothetical protein